jgi:thiol-disulfide isomerase/thioredoxin
MKIRTLLFTLAALVLTACGSGNQQKGQDITTINGNISDPDITQARIVLVSEKIDTVLDVTEGKFAFDVPVAKSSYGFVLLMVDGQGKYGSYYISDGSNLQVSLEENDMQIVSDNEDGIHSAYASYGEEVAAISDDDLKKYKEVSIRTIKENSDNGVALIVLSNVGYYLEPEEMLQVAESLQEPIKSDELVVSSVQAANAKLNTAEGMMFTDFTVEHVYGYDRSVDPQPLKKEVKFSDYVGKGTYVLVDFWSPWCGPCKREIPNIQKVYAEYKDKGLEVLSLAVWERKPQSHTIETAAELGMDWLHINNCGQVPTDIYGVEGIPHLMLIGPDGTILKRGFHGLEGIQEAVAEYLK